MDLDPWPLPEHPLVDAAREVATVLSAEASRVDREGVPASHIDFIKRSGLLGTLGPQGFGGAGEGADVFWAVSELLAAADLSTWFVQAQHHMPVRLTAASALLDDAGRERLLRPLCDGSAMSGVAFSHLRSHPRIVIEAAPVPGGWTLTGTAPWFSGWGLSDTALFSGLTTDNRVVMGFAKPVEQPGLVSSPLELAVMGGTSTVRLTFNELFLADEDVVVVQPYADWAAADAQNVVNAQPAAFGLARAALAFLRESDLRVAREIADELADVLGEIRATALELIVTEAPGAHLAGRLALRVRTGALVSAAVQAVVVVGGGRGMGIDQLPQRLVREAAFLQVQAQTADVRLAQLADMGNWSL